MLANKYIRAIYASANATKCCNEELHDAIMAGFGKKSVKDLTPREARQLLDGLNKKTPWDLNPDYQRRQAMANHGRKDYDRRGDAEYLVSKDEMGMLRYEASLRGWQPEALSKFIHRQIGKTEVRTLAEYNKVYWPLKGMNRRDGIGGVRP